MLSKEYKFSLRTENQHLKKDGKKFYSPFFNVVYVLSQKNTEHAKFNVLLSKAVSKKAVVRNRIKRTIYQALMDVLKKPTKQINVLIIPRSPIQNLDGAEIKSDIINRLGKIIY